MFLCKVPRRIISEVFPFSKAAYKTLQSAGEREFPEEAKIWPFWAFKMEAPYILPDLRKKLVCFCQVMMLLYIIKFEWDF